MQVIDIPMCFENCMKKNGEHCYTEYKTVESRTIDRQVKRRRTVLPQRSMALVRSSLPPDPLLYRCVNRQDKNYRNRDKMTR